MMRLVLSDLRDHAAVWAGAFAVATACGYIGGWVAALLATSSTYGALADLTWSILLFSLLAALPILASTASLTVSAQRRSYALWQLVNVRPWMVSAVVLLQLTVVAVLGAAAGTLACAATFAPLFPVVFGSYDPPANLVLDAGLPSMPAVWLAVAAVFLVGGLKGARSAGATPPLTALRAAEVPRRGMTWLRFALFAALLVCLVQLVLFVLGSNPNVVADNSLFVPILAMATLVPVAPAVLSVLLGAWTALVPQARWNAWYLARHTARFGLGASTTVEVPIMVGFALVASVYSLSSVLKVYVEQQGLIDMHVSLDWTSAVLLLGGPVLLCAVGSAVGVVMSSRSRATDVALLVASGAQPHTLVAAAVCEAFIHAATATFAGAACVVFSTVAVALPIGAPVLGCFSFAEGLAVSLAGFGLVLAATLVPTTAALRREAALVLAVQE